MYPGAHQLADGHFFGPSNSQSHFESREISYNQSSQDTELEADTASSSLLGDGADWGNTQSYPMISCATINTQTNHTPSLVSSSSVDADEPGRGLNHRRPVAVSPATPVDEGDDRKTPSGGGSREADDTPLSPFKDRIPTVDFSRIRIPLAKTRPRPPNHGHRSPDESRAKVSKPASRSQGSHRQSSRVSALQRSIRGRSAEYGRKSDPRLTIPAMKSSKSTHPPIQANGRVVGARSVHHISMDDVYLNKRTILPRRAKSLEPKVESDEDGDAVLLAQAAELVNQAREELLRPRAPARSDELGVGSKRKRVYRVNDEGDPLHNDKGEKKLRRLPSRARPSSLEQEIRFAEAQESTAAAIDLVEQQQLQYCGIGARDSHGFMKGGGAGGRPVWSSIRG